MKRESNFLENDYIIYEGDSSTLSEPLRNPDIGKIKKIETMNGTERIYIHLLNKEEHIWTDFDKIKPIYTSEEILKKIGFSKIENDKNEKYLLGDIIISQCKIISKPNYTICYSGYCAKDLSLLDNKELSKYIKEDKIDISKFRKENNYVHYLTDLFTYLEKNNVALNKKEILNAIHPYK